MPAEKILTSLFRMGGAGSQFSSLKGVAEGDWADVVSAAARHSLAPQLFARLNDLGGLSDLPTEQAERLKNIYIGSVARGARQAAELSEILLRFSENALPVIVLKGPHLAEMVYEDWALRPMVDFDLMVRKYDLDRAVRLLKGSAYEPAKRFDIDSQVRINADLPVLSRGNHFHIELHWTIERPGSPFVIDVGELWKRAVRTTIAGTETLVFCDEDLLLHLCIHAAYHHRFSFGLLPVLDVAGVMDRLGDRIDWGRFVERTRKWNATRCVSLTLRLAEELFGIEVPPMLAKEGLFDGCDQGIVDVAKERMFQTSSDHMPLTSNISRLWGSKGWSEKLGIFLRNAFPSRDFLATVYPVDAASARVFLYYPVRLKDLILRYGKTVFSLWLRKTAAVERVRREEQGNTLVDWLTGQAG